MKILKVVILSLMISMLTGCSDNKVNNKVQSNSFNENNNINYEEEEKKQEERSKQSLWTVLDKEGKDKEMLDSENKDIKAITELINKHCSIVDNRDFKILKVENEYSLYSDNFTKMLEKGNYKESVQTMYDNNKLVLSHENLVWYRNYFNEDITTCKVTVESEFSIKEGSKEYLEKNQMKLDEVYQEKRIYYLEKVNDNWNIVNIEKGALTKRS